MPYYPQNPYEPIMTGMESLSGAIRDVRARDIDRMKEKRLAEQEKMNAQLQNVQVMERLAIQEAEVERQDMLDKINAIDRLHMERTRQEELGISRFGAQTDRMQAEATGRQVTQNIVESQAETAYRFTLRPIDQWAKESKMFDSEKITDPQVKASAKITQQELERQSALGVQMTGEQWSNYSASLAAQSPFAVIGKAVQDAQPIFDMWEGVQDYQTFEGLKALTARESQGVFTVKPVQTIVTTAIYNEKTGDLDRLPKPQIRDGKVYTDEEFKAIGTDAFIEKPILKTDENQDEQYTSVRYVAYIDDIPVKELGPTGTGAGVAGGVPSITKEQIQSMWRKNIGTQYTGKVVPPAVGGLTMPIIPETIKTKEPSTAQMHKKLQEAGVMPGKKQTKDAISRISNDIQDAKGIPNYVLNLSAKDITDPTIKTWLKDSVKSGIIPNDWVIDVAGKRIPVSGAFE